VSFTDEERAELIAALSRTAEIVDLPGWEAGYV
jgi:hypothetical protein